MLKATFSIFKFGLDMTFVQHDDFGLNYIGL